MIIAYILKALGLLAILFMIKCVSSLYKIFVRIQMEDKAFKSDNAGYVAIGIIVEVALIVQIAVQVITG